MCVGGGGGTGLPDIQLLFKRAPPSAPHPSHPLSICFFILPLPFPLPPSLLPSFLSLSPPPSSLPSPPFVQMYQCPYCKFTNTDLNRLRMHVMTQHSVQPMLRCPLCQDTLNNKIHLQFHLTHLHSVAPDCVDKLIATVSPAEVARRFLCVLRQRQQRRFLPAFPFKLATRFRAVFCLVFSR